MRNAPIVSVEGEKPMQCTKATVRDALREPAISRKGILTKWKWNDRNELVEDAENDRLYYGGLLLL